MDIETFWVVVLAVASPVSGVVGFAIQLRQVKKARLENEKLQLEIAALRKDAMASERRIVQATTDEVLSIGHREKLVFGRARTRDSAVPARGRRTFVNAIVIGTAISILVLLGTYLIYDLYRLIVWISSKL